MPDNLSGADLAGIAIRIKEIAVNRHLEINQEGDTDGFKVEQIDVESACNELMGIL